MPAAYAHFTFGQLVIDKVDKKVKNLIENNLSLYNIGLHGPDILFYYKPFKKNFVNNYGSQLHKKTAADFFSSAKKIIKRYDAPEEACAYILGFICHYMLDSECHPIVRKYEKTGISHNKIETEFERVLMLKNELELNSYKAAAHINYDDKYCQCISMFLKNINQNQIKKSLFFMKLYLNSLVCPGYLKRFFVTFLLRITGNYDNLKGLIMSNKVDISFLPINDLLYESYTNAVSNTADIINEYYDNLDDISYMNSRFERNFG